MRNISGAFVVYGPDMEPTPFLLGAGAYAIYLERLRIADATTAAKASFGNAAAYALPCTAECMEFIALNYTGPHQQALRALCARIALGQPIGGDAQNPGKSDSDGGAKVTQKPKSPRKPGPRGAAEQIPVQAVTQ